MTTQNEVIEAIMQCGKKMKQHMAPDANLGELTVLQIQALMYLKHASSSTMTDIAKFFSIELPSATSLIAKLVKREYVERLPDAADRRIVNIVLTPNGDALLSKAMKERTKKMKLLLSVLSDEEQNQLLTILKKFTMRLEASDAR